MASLLQEPRLKLFALPDEDDVEVAQLQQVGEELEEGGGAGARGHQKQEEGEW